ncbi:MAG: hypothetical protein V4645_27175 [Pseudomonadota bacterium]
MTTTTTPAKVWLRFFLFGYFVLMALWIISLTSPVPYGDLTRIGRLSEREFGWRDPPPEVDPVYLASTPIEQADVMVVGDSFSMTHRWQSVLAKAGYRVSTSYWGQYGESLCGDFSQWVHDSGFKGKLVIIESVERLLDMRMRYSERCKDGKTIFPYSAKAEPLIEPDETVPAFAPNWEVQYMTGVVTYYHTWKAKNSPVDTYFDRDTWVRKVPDGCKFFSHRQCDRMPFFQEDEDNGPLTLDTLARMKNFTAAHSTIPLLWMVVPNKTTVYLKPDFSKDFESGLRDAKLGPDLYAFTREKHTQIRDFYFSNDTHMSMHGQLALGERMLAAVREVMPTPPSKSP